MEPFVLWMCIPLCIYFVAHYYQHWNVRNKYSYCSVECTSIILKWFTNNPQNFLSSILSLGTKNGFLSNEGKNRWYFFAWDEKRFLRQKRAGKYIMRCHLLIWLTMFVTCSIGHFRMYKNILCEYHEMIQPKKATSLKALRESLSFKLGIH